MSDFFSKSEHKAFKVYKEAADVILKTIVEHYFSEDEYRALYHARRALLKRAPSKPFDRGTLGQRDRYTYGRRPDCGNGVNYEMLYCDRCGRALDWSEDDGNPV